MRMTLREAVRSFSADLLSIYGFKEGEHFYDSANFGNEILTLESSDFDLRFAEDRGYIYVDIRGTGRGNEWYPLMNVLQLIGQDQEEHTVKPEDMLRALADAVNKCYQELQRLFRQENYLSTKNALLQMEKTKSEEATKRIFGARTPPKQGESGTSGKS